MNCHAMYQFLVFVHFLNKQTEMGVKKEEVIIKIRAQVGENRMAYATLSKSK